MRKQDMLLASLGMMEVLAFFFFTSSWVEIGFPIGKKSVIQNEGFSVYSLFYLCFIFKRWRVKWHGGGPHLGSPPCRLGVGANKTVISLGVLSPKVCIGPGGRKAESKPPQSPHPTEKPVQVPSKHGRWSHMHTNSVHNSTIWWLWPSDCISMAPYYPGDNFLSSAWAAALHALFIKSMVSVLLQNRKQ